MKCNLCESEDTKPLYKGNVECKKCGLIFQDPIPDISLCYPDDYYSYSTNRLPLENLQVFLHKIKIWTPMNRFLRTIKVVPGGNLLDVGCGSGAFLHIAKKLNMNCYGVEPGSFDVNHAEENGFNIYHGFLEDAKYPDNFFDCITMNHSLEHMNDPMSAFKEAHRILKSDGLLRIAVPQSKSLAHWLFKENWIQLDPPRHLFNFSTSCLKSYADKTGFKVKKIRYVSSPMGFGVKNKWLFALLYPISTLCNFLHVGDTVEMVLRKKRTIILKEK